MDVQLKKGVLNLCVLSIVSKTPSYGYDIYQNINRSFKISESTIYPILRKMVTENHLNTYLEESPEGPPRKYFEITKLGKKHLKYLLDEWHAFNEHVNYIIGGLNE